MPYWTGLIAAGGLFQLGNLLMLPAMLLAMLHRRAEYTAAHTRHHSGRRQRPLFPGRWSIGNAGVRPAPLRPAISPTRDACSSSTLVDDTEFPRSPS